MADSGMERGSATLRDMSHNETLSARRASMAATWALTREIVLVPSGLPIPIAGTDQAHGHHAHSAVVAGGPADPPSGADRVVIARGHATGTREHLPP